jgi:hypothetical protein
VRMERADWFGWRTGLSGRRSAPRARAYAGAGECVYNERSGFFVCAICISPWSFIATGTYISFMIVHFETGVQFAEGLE